MIFGSARSSGSSSQSGSSLVRWTLIIVGLALYLNIGWAYGTWHYQNVDYQETDTVVEAAAAGAWDIMKSGNDFSEEEQSSEIWSQVIFSVAWPILAVVTLGSWLVFGFYKLLWLIFAGGIAKLLGVG